MKRPLSHAFIIYSVAEPTVLQQFAWIFSLSFSADRNKIVYSGL